MRSSAARKQEVTQDTESAEKKRLHIAQQAEEACHLKGNINGPDFEEFSLQYNPRKTSDFA